MDTELKKKLDEFQSKLKQDPNNGLLWYEYGNFLDEEFDSPDKTVHALEKAQELLPNVDLRPRIGESYDRAGEFEKAISIIQESINQNPQSSAYCMLANVYIRNDMYNYAVSACEKALELDPYYEEAYYLLGNAVRHNARERAIQYYRDAIRLDPEYQLAWQALGRELIAQKSTIEEGILALRKAIALNSEDGWAWIFLANALARKGNNAEADKAYREAIAAFPDYPDFRRWYDQFLAGKV